MMRSVMALVLFLALSQVGIAQISAKAVWTSKIDKTTVKVGEEVTISFDVKIADDWYIYSSDFDKELGPIVTEVNLSEGQPLSKSGEMIPDHPKRKFDDLWGGEVAYFEKKAHFEQKIKITAVTATVSGYVLYQACSNVTGQCIPYEEDFSFAITVKASAEKVTGTPATEEPKVATPKESLPKTDKPEQGNEGREEVIDEPTAFEPAIEIDAAGPTDVVTAPATTKTENTGPLLPESFKDKSYEESMLLFLFFAFLAGLTALLTPCVFPLIPMTVTFFTGQKGGKGKALFYGFSIVFIYTLTGVLVAPFMGPETANALATNWLPNMIFFAVFIFFALSFLGMYEIVLPGSLSTKVDRQADKGGYTGVFFMALTLVIVSFSCTGPIAATVLVESAGGAVIKPIITMFAFGLALALPFTLFAFFPAYLNRLPKSGGWLNSVKVILGFLELALAFKFLSVADQAYHWGILDREVNIAIWIVIFTLIGFYLLGKLRLPHDSPVESVSVPRLLMAIASFAFVVYLIPGLVGAPLKALAGYLPPMHSHDFDLVSMLRPESEKQEGTLCDEPKYADFLHLPHGLEGYFDYDQAIACARAQQKPLFIDFTGHGCVNCREMEAAVWSDPAVLSRLREDFVVVALYVDDKTLLPESEWYTGADGKVKNTIGRQNLDLEITNLNMPAQPYYIIVGDDEQVLVEPLAYDKDVSRFVGFLDKAKMAYKERFGVIAKR